MFDFSLQTRLVCGAGSVDRLGELARGLGASRVFLVTDPGVVAAGHAERALASLMTADLEAVIFGEVRENPSTVDVAACLAAMRSADPDLIVAVGGGSSIDTAKGANFLHTNGGRMEDYWGIGKATKPLIAMIAVPTTAGTGSEVQSFALIEQDGTHQKMACGDRTAAPRIAVLDPNLTLSQPRAVAAATGMDAIGHAVETAVTRKRSELSQLFSTEAFRLANEALPRIMHDETDVDARSEMLAAAAFAGIAIEESMLGAAHSLANPLTARFAVAHGQAVGMMLPHVVRFNGEDATAAGYYRHLASTAGLCGVDAPRAEALEALETRLFELLRVAEMPPSLSACGVSPSAVPELAASAAKQWTAQFNPREVSVDDLAELYTRAFGD